MPSCFKVVVYDVGIKTTDIGRWKGLRPLTRAGIVAGIAIFATREPRPSISVKETSSKQDYTKVQ
jgi:hypothetical protein